MRENSKKQLKMIVGDTIHLELDDLKSFQGDLKEISPENLEKLIARIKDVGFCDAFVVWYHDNEYWLLNGHQRKIALIKMKSDNWDIPKLPAVQIKATSEKHARRVLASIESKFGDINQLVAKEWLEELEGGTGDTLRFMSTAIDFNLEFDIEVGSEEGSQGNTNTKSTTICPQCDYEWREGE